MKSAHPIDHRLQATVIRVAELTPGILGIRLSCPEVSDYKAGQYIRVWIDEHRVKSFSLASAPSIDGELQLHVKCVAGSEVSRWLHEEMRPGDTLYIERPQGRSFYTPSRFDQPILMIGTGSGLAPLYGMAREALRQGHRGEIHLYHGVRYREELYLTEQLRALSSLNRNFHYSPCLSRERLPEHGQYGRASNLAVQQIPLSSQWLVYLSGNIDMVRDAAQVAVDAGVPPEAVLSDMVRPEELCIKTARAA